MFNLYTIDICLNDSTRQSIVETIRHFLKITDRELIDSFLSQALNNYQSYTYKCEESLKSNQAAAIAVEEKIGKQMNKVVFDFQKTKRDTVKSNNIENQNFLFAKYAFLDLICVLVKYSSDRAIIESVYQLAQNGIIVNFFQNLINYLIF